MKIYLAGPLFTWAERMWNLNLCEELEALGHEVFLPQRDAPQDDMAVNIFAADRKGVEESQVVVAIMDGADADSGTCWECGYAYGLRKPVVLVRTDFRTGGDSDYDWGNLMLTQSAVWVIKHVPVNLKDLVDVEPLAAKIHEGLEGSSDGTAWA